MLKPFKLYEPTTLKEAIMLSSENKGAVYVSGGTDVFIEMHSGLVIPVIIDLKNVDELNGVEFSKEKGLKIGALTTYRELLHNEDVKKYYPALIDGISKIGSVQVRSRGTISGNICNASPAADTAGPLLLYDSIVTVQGEDGERKIKISEFFTGPKKTCLRDTEVVKSVTLGVPVKNSGSAYLKLMKRGAMEIGIMSAGVRVACDDIGKCNFAHITLSAVAPTPIRVQEAENFLIGKELIEENILKAADIAYEIANPKTWRNSEEWSKDMVEVYVPRSMNIAKERMQKGEF